MLGRFYAICNCCSCCCGVMQSFQNGTPMLASSGYVAQVDADLCAGCGSCADYCQFAAIAVDDGFARIRASACMGCGVCVAHCPQEAIDLVRDPAKGIPLEIRELMNRAAN
jgi:MinD superfamily P-loop ATPase